MSRSRNDAGAIKRRREGALARWKANRDREYLHRYFVRERNFSQLKSDPQYVDNQISILERLTRTQL